MPVYLNKDMLCCQISSGRCWTPLRCYRLAFLTPLCDCLSRALAPGRLNCRTRFFNVRFLLLLASTGGHAMKMTARYKHACSRRNFEWAMVGASGKCNSNESNQLCLCLRCYGRICRGPSSTQCHRQSPQPRKQQSQISVSRVKSPSGVFQFRR